MGSGGSKTQSSDQKPVPSSNDYKSHTVGTAPKDTNANSGGQSTNESTAASEGSTNQKTIDQKTLAPSKQTESQGSEPKEIKKQVEEDPSRVESSTANQKKEEETNKTDPPPVSQTKQADSAMPVSSSYLTDKSL